MFAQRLMHMSRINSNVQMTAFWMMAHLLQRPDVAAAVREEIGPAMKALESSETIDGANLADVAKRDLTESCPLLNSAFNEVLRVSSTGSTVREVMRPVRIGGKTIPIGTKVLIPQRQLLLATEGFGSNAHEVDLSRFLKDKSLARHDYYRPFGGGVTLCTGRFVGKREVLTFVALALWRYDMQVLNVGEDAHGVQGMLLPRLDEAKPSLGISKQVEGDDMIVKLTNRQR